MSKKLKRCPFCGSGDVRLQRGQIVGNRADNGMRFVRCMDCGASTAYRQKFEAVGNWNMRARDTAGRPCECGRIPAAAIDTAWSCGAMGCEVKERVIERSTLRQV